MSVRGTHTHTHNQERDRDRETERDRGRDREREKQRQTDRERQRQNFKEKATPNVVLEGLLRGQPRQKGACPRHTRCPSRRR